MSFVKIGSVKAIPYVEAYMNFCPYFPNLLPDLSEIRYKKS